MGVHPEHVPMHQHVTCLRRLPLRPSRELSCRALVFGMIVAVSPTRAQELGLQHAAEVLVSFQIWTDKRTYYIFELPGGFLCTMFLW